MLINSYRYASAPPPAWQPDDETGLLLWLDGSNAATRVQSGANLTTWANQGSVGGVMNATGVTVVTAGQNGLDYIQTTKAGDAGEGLYHASYIMDEPDLTVFAALMDNEITGNDRIHTIFDFQEKQDSYNGGVFQSYNAYASDGSNYVLHTNGNGSSSTQYVNGVASTPDTDTTVTGGAWAVWGATWEGLTPLSGAGQPITMGVTGEGAISSTMKFGEIVVYQGVKSAPVIAQIVEYLATKWGIT